MPKVGDKIIVKNTKAAKGGTGIVQSVHTGPPGTYVTATTKSGRILTALFKKRR